MSINDEKRESSPESIKSDLSWEKKTYNYWEIKNDISDKRKRLLENFRSPKTHLCL